MGEGQKGTVRKGEVRKEVSEKMNGAMNGENDKDSVEKQGAKGSRKNVKVRRN